MLRPLPLLGCLFLALVPAHAAASPLSPQDDLRPRGPGDCAFPVNPNPVRVTQPDGSRLTLSARGSAWNLWFEDAAGRPVLRHDGRYVFARLDGAGRLVPTEHPAGTRTGAPATLPRHVTPRLDGGRRVEAVRHERGTVGEPFAAAAGTARNLVLLLRFADHGPGGQNRTLPSDADVDVIMNRVGGDPVLAPTGSVRDHYEENSYGQFSIQSTVVGWLDVPGNEADYADGISGLGPVVWDLITDGLAAADPLVDFADFDEDGDGWIDAITFLHSGYGAEWVSVDQYGTPYEDRIWSHKWTIPTWTSAEGVKVGNYNISPGLWSVSGSEPGRIGVVVHELGHFFGLPDVYDTDGSSQGIGNWDVMAGGAWGFDGSQRYPSHMSAWSKIKLGWLEPTLLRPGGWSLAAVESAPQVYRLDSGYPAGEYVLVENRQAQGFDAVIPQSGLAIWHVDETKGSFGYNDPNQDEGYPGQSGWPTNGNHYRVALLQADGDFDMEQGSNRGDSGDLYHGFGVDEISGTTSPDLQAYQGGTVLSNGNVVRDIGASQAVMTFEHDNPSLPVVDTTLLATGRVGEAYAFALSGSAGAAPYEWSEFRPEPSYTVQTTSGSLPLTGVPMGWQDDDANWQTTLPFPFPFYETQYTRITVSSNGYVDLVASEDSEPFNDPLYMRSTLRIAPLWDDLTTAGSGDVYLDFAGTHARIRWQGTTTASGDPVSFAAVLYDDGRIAFEYGGGNTNLTPTVGISRGYGSDFLLLSGYDGQATLTAAATVELVLEGSRLPRGLELLPSGMLVGVPEEYGVFRPTIRVTDSAHNYEQRTFTLTVAPRTKKLELSGQPR